MPHTSSSPDKSENHSQMLYLFRAIISLRQAVQNLLSVLSVENTANDPFSWLSQSSILLERQSASPKLVYNYLLAARIVQGFSTSAFESLMIPSIGDIYFVHQRGTRVAFQNFIQNSASSLASICGQVFASLGWLWLFHMFQIFLVVQFVLMFLFCPETTYLRDVRYETDLVVNEKLDELAKIKERH
jgi:MFS family permease